MNRICLFMHFFCIFSCFVASGHCHEPDLSNKLDKSGIIKEIEQAFQSRRDIMESVSLEISLEWQFSPLFVFYNSKIGEQEHASISPEKLASIQAMPKVKSSQVARLVFQKERMRYERSGERPGGAYGELKAFSQIATSNGFESKSFASDTEEKEGFGRGFVYAHNANEATMDITTLPARAFYYGPGETYSGVPDFSVLIDAEKDDTLGIVQFKEKITKGNRGSGPART